MHEESLKIVQELYPQNDGWLWLYRAYFRFIRPVGILRSFVRGYFRPKPVEVADNGRLYRVIGVSKFERFIPTGGIAIRKLTGAKMAPYTLASLSIRAVRDFRYRTVVFKTLHIPFFLALLILSINQYFKGRVDLAIEDMVVNLVFNLYPMMHQRYTRVRIDRLLSIANKRSRS